MVNGMSNCLKEQCEYYDPISEAAYDGCMYGAFEGDYEIKQPCKRKEQTKE